MGNFKVIQGWILFISLCFILTSCIDDHTRCQEEISALETRVSELESELDDARSTIADYEYKFDQIQDEASSGYDAISYFNWSYELQEALDAFENIQNEASY